MRVLQHPGLLIAAALVTLLGVGPLRAQTYQIDGTTSVLEVHTKKAGFFSSAGHVHRIQATGLSGTVVVVPGRPSLSKVTLDIPTRGLAVKDTGLSEKDRATVQGNMLGGKVLDSTKFPTIHFVSTKVTGRPDKDGAWPLTIEGALELHGQKKSITLPAQVVLTPGTLTASGEFEIDQRDFGITPFRAMLGAVGVKPEVKVSFQVVAHPADGSSPGSATQPRR